MSSIVIAGNTSGAITLSAPNVSGTNTATLPAATGDVMVSGNMPAFSARPSTSQTISNNTATKITLGTEEFDTNNNFASSTFTPTVAGYYNIAGQIRIDFTAGRQLGFTILIYKNGSTYLSTENSFVVGTGSSFTPVITTLVPMNGTGDTIELYAYFYDYTALASYSTVASQVRLQGCLVRTL
jgi:hypothetical protein